MVSSVCVDCDARYESYSKDCIGPRINLERLAQSIRQLIIDTKVSSITSHLLLLLLCTIDLFLENSSSKCTKIPVHMCSFIISFDDVYSIISGLHRSMSNTCKRRRILLALPFSTLDSKVRKVIEVIPVHPVHRHVCSQHRFDAIHNIQ